MTYVVGKATLYTPGGGELVSSSSMTGTGSSGGTAVANDGTCKVASWLSTVYWRGGKPRTYLPGVSTSETTGDHSLTAGEITALKTAAAGFRTAVNALTSGGITGTTLGFVSFRTGNADRVPPLFYAFTGATVHPRLGTQRRRLGHWVT